MTSLDRSERGADARAAFARDLIGGASIRHASSLFFLARNRQATDGVKKSLAVAVTS